VGPDYLILAVAALMGIIALLPAFLALIRPWNILAAPTLVGGAFFFFYAYFPYALLRSPQRNMLPDWVFGFGILVAMLSLLSFYGGWALQRSGKRHRGPHVRFYSSQALYNAGLVWAALAVIGALAFVLFSGGWSVVFSKQHGEAFEWDTTSAYVYDSWKLIFPAILLMLQSVVCRRNHSWLQGSSLFVIAISGLVLIESILRTTRAEIFFLAVIWAFVPQLMRLRPPTRVRTSLIMLVGGAMVLLYMALRPYVYIGADWREIVSLESSDVQTSVEEIGQGNEFAYHAALVSACYDTGEYDYGQSIVGVVINFIPRFLWKGKPYGTYRILPAPLVFQNLGWMPAYGSAATGAAMAFFEWGIFALLFWFLLGWVARSLFNRARLGDGAAIGCYSALVCVLFVLCAVGINAALEMAIFFMVPLLLSYAWASVLVPEFTRSADGGGLRSGASTPSSAILGGA